MGTGSALKKLLAATFASVIIPATAITGYAQRSANPSSSQGQGQTQGYIKKTALVEKAPIPNNSQPLTKAANSNFAPIAPSHRVKAGLVMSSDFPGIALNKNAGNKDTLLHPASTSKWAILALLLTDVKSGKVSQEDLHRKHKMEASDFASEHNSGHKAGDEVSLNEALEGGGIASFNDYINFIGRIRYGSIENALKETNAFTQNLGMKNTKWNTLHGLYGIPKTDMSKYNVTTPRDMCLLLAYYQKELMQFLPIFAKPNVPVPKSGKFPNGLADNTNARILGNDGRMFSQAELDRDPVLKAADPVMLGGKTGWIGMAGRTIIFIAEIKTPDGQKKYLLGDTFGHTDTNNRFSMVKDLVTEGVKTYMTEWYKRHPDFKPPAINMPAYTQLAKVPGIIVPYVTPAEKIIPAKKTTTQTAFIQQGIAAPEL